MEKKEPYITCKCKRKKVCLNTFKRILRLIESIMKKKIWLQSDIKYDNNTSLNQKPSFGAFVLKNPQK